MSAPGKVYDAASKQWISREHALMADLGHGNWRPVHNKLLAASCDPATATSLLAISAGFIWLNKIWVPDTITVANMHIGIQVAGASLTAGQNLAGLYDASGNLICKTADQATAWQSTGMKSMPLTAEAGQSLTIPGGPGVWIYGALLANGTTAPSVIMRPITGTNVLAAANLNLTATDGFRCAFTTTGSRTALVSPLPALSSASDPYVFFMGLS